MKIMKIAAECGSPYGTVNLEHLVDSIDLENGRYILSLRDDLHYAAHEKSQIQGQFELGEAKATVQVIGLTTRVAIESTSVSDFIALEKAVYVRLGFKCINLSVPPQSFPEQSLVVGLRNDLRNLYLFLQNRWEILRQSVRRRFAS